ncbi:MAG: M23 family metallopeptidase [Myxococcota bacterium]
MTRTAAATWLVVSGCARDWCGRGTIERDGRCVAEPVDVPPVLLPPSLLCGPGTVEVDGVCVPDEPIVECGPDTVVRGDQCVGLSVVDLTLPFPAGTTWTVLQGAHGSYSHTGTAVYAIDFAAPEGSPVVAARAGRVVELSEGSSTGCADPACSSDANYVVLDHGDATFGQYWHLQRDGVYAQVGDVVGRGEELGRTGNTGWSTEPHLHLQVRDALGQSLRMRFVDQPGGVVFAGGAFTSGTELEPAPELDWSTCPADLLGFLGVTLGPGVPCAQVDVDQAYPVRGEVLVPGALAAVGQWSTVAGDWAFQCLSNEAAGSFAAELAWPAEKYPLRSYLVAAAVDPETCTSYQGWDSSIYLTVHPVTP